MQGNDLALLQDAAREAGKLALRHAMKTPHVTDKPGGAGPVTDADLAVDALLKARLTTARPDYGWLSEETPDSDARLTHRHTFIVDPIDGTRSFIAGTKDWAHSLAIARDGVVVAAVVFLPCHKALYAAEIGGGATLNGRRIQVSSVSDMGSAKVLTAKPTMESQHWATGQVPPFQRKFRSSLAWRMCLVAEGAFDGMVTLRPTWEWDIAGGALILSEAGGTVTDRTGQPLQFNNVMPQTNGVVAAPTDLHRQIAHALI
ncbi:inositol monophosphatase family protein [Flavimaricola marinus]|uniref:Inositol-1-monophosphatase n=1 Tax=Flavimaricola marinus TaxID=1819565 RepID=A0A238LFC9_9RHOB|nr:3'(2'),5'-bisphosphate nucleotidase CysQ [Flavimaricola marinus]SMY08318.1 Inositol-1-monophosphatase [Flavimaricola marinus]